MVRGAITSGELDIYPEYTGMGRSSLKMKTMRHGKMPGKARESQKTRCRAKQVNLADARAANNTWTIAVRQDVAEKNKLIRLPT